MDPHSRLILALDKMELEPGLQLLSKVPPEIAMVKLNDIAEAHMEKTLSVVGAKNHRVWLDWKYHDMPDTIRARAKKAKAAGVSAVTVHAQGGKNMILAAKESGMMIITVTRLTSLSDEDFARLYPGADPQQFLLAWANESVLGHADAIVCSAKHVSLLNDWRDGRIDGETKQIKIVTPGTRSRDKKTHDQKQVDTPYNAILNGSDYLVIGRQATEAADPTTELERIAEEIAPAIEARMNAGTWRD